MNQNKADKLIVKLFENSISEKESELLQEWLQKEESLEYFNEFTEINYLLNSKNKFEYQTSLEKTKERIKEKPLNKFSHFYKYAAIFIAVLGMAYILQQQFYSGSNQIIPKQEVITLQLEDGTLKEISTSISEKVYDKDGKVIGNHNADKISYQTQSYNDVLRYNTLNIPYGKTFELILSDGTSVHLNSGSSIQYPVNFIKGNNREVFLSGEAYLGVAKDKKHPFILHVNKVAVEVLGTQFNVMAYNEDATTDIVLVEGAVKLSKDKTNTAFLSPGMKGSISSTSENSKFSVTKVNTGIYTSWINGRLVFRNMPFKNVIKKIERKYNVKIINKNMELGEEEFNGSIDSPNVEQVLSYFKDLHNINYQIKDNTIYIK